jgi:hypothetical protein
MFPPLNANPEDSQTGRQLHDGDIRVQNVSVLLISCGCVFHGEVIEQSQSLIAIHVPQAL